MILVNALEKIIIHFAGGRGGRGKGEREGMREREGGQEGEREKKRKGKKEREGGKSQGERER